MRSRGDGTHAKQAEKLKRSEPIKNRRGAFLAGSIDWHSYPGIEGPCRVYTMLDHCPGKTWTGRAVGCDEMPEAVESCVATGT